VLYDVVVVVVGRSPPGLPLWNVVFFLSSLSLSAFAGVLHSSRVVACIRDEM